MGPSLFLFKGNLKIFFSLLRKKLLVPHSTGLFRLKKNFFCPSLAFVTIHKKRRLTLLRTRRRVPQNHLHPAGYQAPQSDHTTCLRPDYLFSAPFSSLASAAADAVALSVAVAAATLALCFSTRSGKRFNRSSGLP